MNPVYASTRDFGTNPLFYACDKHVYSSRRADWKEFSSVAGKSVKEQACIHCMTKESHLLWCADAT